MSSTINNVYIVVILVCVFSQGCENLTITSSKFVCGKAATVKCSWTSANETNSISWFKDEHKFLTCSVSECQFPNYDNYVFSANDGVWTIAIKPVEFKNDNITFTCEAYSDKNTRPSITIDVSVPIDNSSTLDKDENSTDVLLKAEANCVKPVSNVTITWQCVMAGKEKTIESDCQLSTPFTYTSKCNNINQMCAGPGTFRSGSILRLTAYQGTSFKMVRFKAVFTDGTNVVEKISGEVKQEVPPRIRPLRNCSVNENANFSAICSLSSGDSSTVNCTWTTPSGAISHDFNLRIPRIQRTSSGTYTCRVENSGGTDTTSFYLNIMYPPKKPVLKIVNTDVTDLTAYVLKDTPVVVRCLSSAKPNTLSYAWQPTEGSVNSELQITDTSSPFTRMYTCTVTNYMTPSCVGTDQQGSNSSNVTIQIVYPPEGPAVRFNGRDEIDTSGSISVVKGQSFTLTCSAKSDPASTYRWDPLIHEGDLLYVNNISLDQYHTCIASNEMRLYNGSTVVGQSKKTVNIDVIYAPSLRAFRPWRILEGSNFSQICDTTPGRPIETNYLWTRQSGILSENKRVLTITSVNPQHADYYTCTAWNVLSPSYGFPSNGTDRKNFSLEILYPPRLKTIANQSVMEGWPYTQNCEFLRHGNPPGKITWFSIDQAGNEVQIESVNGSFTIANVSRNDQGSFKCLTENNMELTDKEMVKGKDFKIFYLNVFSIEERQSPNIGSINGGVAGGGSAIVVIAVVVVVVVVVIFRRKAAAKSRNSSDQIGQNVHPESIDDGHDGMGFNQACGSKDTLTAPVASGSNSVYAQVDKTKKEGTVNTDNTYAVVDKTSKKGAIAIGQGDVYGTPLKRKPGKNTEAHSKQKGKKTKKGKVAKQKGLGDFCENAQELNVYGNIGQKDETAGNVYETGEEPPAYKRHLNRDGLIYADLAFENKNKGHKKLVIHGLENATDYVHVDFSKRAEPLPDSDDEGDIA